MAATSTPRPTFTAFDKAQVPVNLLTVKEWRFFAESAYGLRSWMSAARKYAAIKGGALIMRADGSLIVLTKLETGKIRQTTYQPNAWGFV